MYYGAGLMIELEGGHRTSKLNKIKSSSVDSFVLSWQTLVLHDIQCLKMKKVGGHRNFISELKKQNHRGLGSFDLSWQALWCYMMLRAGRLSQKAAKTNL
ncbi:hypothetical protein EVAR_56633_1 [Eumeta japonica]|uniref:Uncharacterized protein n=1 Tax=Eumeta variegata TaxID=151549 RepID=A0A4C1XJT6_EUMVA|nr:hypothetical protein EVAR_56633_1 [Eumeta japonica]